MKLTLLGDYSHNDGKTDGHTHQVLCLHPFDKEEYPPIENQKNKKETIVLLRV